MNRASPRRLRRIAAVTAVVLVFLILSGAAVLWLVLRASLPAIDGSAALRGLHAPVVIARDAAGVPTLTATDRVDLARALGYVHAQDRFFQMDLLRRAAAGELSALLGPALIATDKHLRVHQFRAVARQVVDGLDPDQRAVLDAYAAGVNAGLAALRSRPFEYWVLWRDPQAWSSVDSVLVIHAMYLQLQNAQGHGQLQRGLLQAALPEAVRRFVDAGAPEWSATIDGSQDAEPQLPSAAQFNLRALRDAPTAPPAGVLEELASVGSNNWAVAGSHTANGAAIVANDMHLTYRVPNIWYRARLVVTGPLDAFSTTGVTLPGAPTTVAGSNGSIAWGFTNSYGQFSNVVRLMPVEGDASAYATAHGKEHLRYDDESIEVAGAPTEHLRVAHSAWGPVVGEDWTGRPYALQWTAHDPSATNMQVLTLEQTTSTAAALRAAASFGIPGQNFVVADSQGHIGWTIAGRLPGHGNVSNLPQLSTDSAVGFAGWLDPEEQPRVIDPVSGFLWSANAQVVDDARIGEDGADRGARAAQIHADLEAAPAPFSIASSLGVQLDDRALFLVRWKTLLEQTLDAAPADRIAAAPIRSTLSAWTGHAAPDDPAYRLVALFRDQVEARVFYMLIAPARRLAPAFEFEIPSRFEGPLWRVVQARPEHLLAAAYADWNALLFDALTAAVQLPKNCSSLPTCTWGRVNTVHVRHPLSRALPFLAAFLDMPSVSVAGGHSDMPRIQGRDYGASERFSVAPGHEAEGYFHMPGAQSGHPLSAFYRAGFADWAQARPAPFLPGATAHQLTLTP